jgi:hypothetical protein
MASNPTSGGRNLGNLSHLILRPPSGTTIIVVLRIDKETASQHLEIHGKKFLSSQICSPPAVVEPNLITPEEKAIGGRQDPHGFLLVTPSKMAYVYYIMHF